MRRLVFFLVLLGGAACVPADGAFGLGSVEFKIKGSRGSEFGVLTEDRADGNPNQLAPWSLEFDRVILGFRTMTIGKVGDDSRCAFRGRGEQSDIVFDPRRTIVQSFNGISPANCEDTGVFLSPPGDTTDIGPGATAADLFELVQDVPSHAIIDVTARRREESFVVRLRFDTLRTASRFGGCAGRFEAKGVRVRANERTIASTTFAPENMFQNSLGFGGSLRLDPFIFVDNETAEPDGVMTMAEADAFPLSSFRNRGFGDGYQLPNGTTAGSFGDFLRALFRFTFLFKEVGTCVGNEPGTENE